MSYDDLSFQKKTCYKFISKLPQKDKLLVLRALKSAEKWHRSQKRIYTKQTPYIIHIYGVLNILINELGIKNPELLAAAALHDTIEDCGITYEKLNRKFGKFIADMVKTETQDFFPNRRTYMEHFKTGSTNVKLLKMSDRIDNLRTIGYKIKWPKEKIIQYVIESEKYILPISAVNALASSKLKDSIQKLKTKSTLKSLYKLSNRKDIEEYEDTGHHKSKTDSNAKRKTDLNL